MSVTSSKDKGKGNSKSSGVADYFAILGVGARLVCKHTQLVHYEQADDADIVEDIYTDNDRSISEGERFLR